MTLKTYADKKGQAVQFEYVALGSEIVDEMKNDGLMKKGRQFGRDDLKEYLLSTCTHLE